MTDLDFLKMIDRDEEVSYDSDIDIDKLIAERDDDLERIKDILKFGDRNANGDLDDSFQDEIESLRESISLIDKFLEEVGGATFFVHTYNFEDFVQIKTYNESRYYKGLSYILPYVNFEALAESESGNWDSVVFRGETYYYQSSE